jgi:hypothetical protein
VLGGMGDGVCANGAFDFVPAPRGAGESACAAAEEEEEE